MGSPRFNALLRTLGGDATLGSYFARVSAAGGTLSAGTKTAVTALVAAWQASGVWPALYAGGTGRVNLFCGDFTACFVPLLVGAGAATDTNNNFVSGDYTEATGLTGDGLATGGGTKYLETGLLASALTPFSTHLSVYSRSSSTVASNGIGAQAGTGSELRGYMPFADGNVYSDQYNAIGADGRLSAAVTGPFATLLITRTANNAQAIYQRGVSKNTSSATVTNTIPALTVNVFRSNGGSVPTDFAYSNHPLAYYSFGAGMTAQQAQDHHTALQAFQASLGRQV